MQASTSMLAEGTRSILDIAMIALEPGEMCSACRFDDEDLVERYGTGKPTRAAIEADLDLLEDIERGTCRYCSYHDDDGAVVGYFFAGYSFD